jgi:hypothetical protein
MSNDPSYYDCDFDFSEWSEYCAAHYTLPAISEGDLEDESTTKQAHQWDDFYQSHSGGNFFKARKYLSQEFKKWLERSRIVLEVSCVTYHA